MAPRKTLRDALIIAVIVIAAFFILRSRQPGPIERAEESFPAGNQTIEDLSMVHGAPRSELSAGETLVALDDRSVGREWFEETAAREQAALLSQDWDEAMAEQIAGLAALVNGCEELIVMQAVEELGLEPDPEALAERERAFFSPFEHEEEAVSFLEQMGMSMGRLRAKWERDLLQQALFSKVAEMQGLDPGEDGAEEIYREWLIDRLFHADFVFADPELEVVFHEYLEEVRQAAAGDAETGGEEGEETVESPGAG